MTTQQFLSRLLLAPMRSEHPIVFYDLSPKRYFIECDSLPMEDIKRIFLYPNPSYNDIRRFVAIILRDGRESREIVGMAFNPVTVSSQYYQNMLKNIL